MAVNPANHRKKAYPQHARENIKLGMLLSNIAWTENELRTRYREMDLAEVPALKTYVDIQFRKLAKVLPDLKAVELSGQLETALKITVNVGD